MVGGDRDVGRVGAGSLLISLLLFTTCLAKLRSNNIIPSSIIIIRNNTKVSLMRQELDILELDYDCGFSKNENNASLLIGLSAVFPSFLPFLLIVQIGRGW